MDILLDGLRDLPPVAGYLVAALLVAAETGLVLGLVLPGEATLLLVGFLAYQGTLRLVPAVLLMTVAALVGDHLAYNEGVRLGDRVRRGRLGRRVGNRRWEKADALLSRHGGRAVCVARFIAFARTLTPRLAGMSGVRYRTFALWDAVGVVGSVPVAVLVGYLAGGSYDRVAGAFGRATGALALLLLVIVALVLVGRYLGRNRQPVTAFGARLVSTRPLRWARRAYRTGFDRLTGRYGLAGATAVNLAVGVVGLLVIGAGLSWVVDRLVRHSGVPLVDPLLTGWVAARRDPGMVRAARAALAALPGSLVVVAVTVAVAVQHWRFPITRVRRQRLLGVVGTAGLFVPPLVLAVAADLGGTALGLLSGQVTVVAASLGMLAWSASRRLNWAGGVAVWTASVGAPAVLGAARVYAGWNWPSEVFASMLLGALWVLVFAVAWHTRDQVLAGEADPGPDPEEILMR
ncbi:MAG TPA: VTT domain-containing protein [Micromonosporaceae bacterium]